MPTAIPASIECLQNAVSLHLTAIEHYTTVSEHLYRIGYTKLGERFRADVDEEREHLSKALARLEYFNTPTVMAHVAPQWTRYDVPGILDASLKLEQMAADAERAHIVEVRSAGDEGTAVVFVELLAGSEKSIKELEADKFLISQVGLHNWLANQT